MGQVNTLLKQPRKDEENVMTKRRENSAAKGEVKPEPVYNPRKSVVLDCGKTEAEIRQGYAALVTSPELAGYRIIHIAEQGVGIGTQIDVPALMERLRDEAAAVNRGDLTQAEAMLMNQATALQSLFARLTERSIGCDSISSFEVHMRMALRAQSQCRTTLETLAMIKNPPMVYAHQANIAHGNQQVNNNSAGPISPEDKKVRNICPDIPEKTRQLTRAEIKSEQNKVLMEVQRGQTVDARGTDEASETDSAVEAVENVNRTANTRR